MLRAATLIVLALAAASAAAEPDVFCDDPAAVADWKARAAEHSDSDTWQRLHALWLGLCDKVKAGSLEAPRAIGIFERERRRAIREERRRAEQQRKRDIERIISPPPFDTTG